jgi:hypothetical protein
MKEKGRERNDVADDQQGTKEGYGRLLRSRVYAKDIVIITGLYYVTREVLLI